MGSAWVSGCGRRVMLRLLGLVILKNQVSNCEILCSLGALAHS